MCLSNLGVGVLALGTIYTIIQETQIIFRWLVKVLKYLSTTLTKKEVPLYQIILNTTGTVSDCLEGLSFFFF